jgi:hypothetical protein
MLSCIMTDDKYFVQKRKVIYIFCWAAKMNAEEQKMEWNITIEEEKQFAEIITRGIADEAGSRAMARDIAETMGRNQIRKLIIDQRNISAVTGDLGKVFARPKELQKMGIEEEIKVAEVVKPEHETFFKFLEIVFVNRGCQFSVFHDKKSAMEWLQIAG